jgi:uncharacterized protein with PQ loop repeat
VALSVSIQNIAGGSPDLHDLAVGAGYLGAALGVLMVLPQIARTFQNRARLGVSPMSWALTALSCLTWMLYGVRADEAPQIPGNILMVTGAAVIVLAVPAATSVRMRAVRLALPALAIIGLAIILPPAAIGFLAFGIGLVSALPQTVRSLRSGREEGSGVSVLAWLLRAASQVSWLIYAVVLHDVVVTISAAFILTSSLALVASELRNRRRVAPDQTARIWLFRASWVTSARPSASSSGGR